MLRPDNGDGGRTCAAGARCLRRRVGRCDTRIPVAHARTHARIASTRRALQDIASTDFTPRNPTQENAILVQIVLRLRFLVLDFAA
eukprot:2361270-Rhodomonas_salina.2